MTESMIERVAEAIYQKRNGFGCKPWARLTRSHQEPYKSDASAAIAAMREPTDAMVHAATRRADNGDRESIYHSIWRSMIDAALNDKGSE